MITFINITNMPNKAYMSNTAFTFKRVCIFGRVYIYNNLSYIIFLTLIKKNTIQIRLSKLEEVFIP